MLTITLTLLICQHMSSQTVWSTRLPLEVYELTPAPVTAAAAATTTTVAAATTRTHVATSETTAQNNNNNNSSSSSGSSNHYKNDLNYKTLEYITINDKTATPIITKATTDNNNNNNNQNQNHTTNQTIVNNDVVINEDDDAATAAAGNGDDADDELHKLQLDRRRARQMFDLKQQQQQHRFSHDAFYMQKLQQQQHLFQVNNNNNNNNNRDPNKKHQLLMLQQHGLHLPKDVRVLYQVGDSEDDLPICAPNAVCSKIDLYETPWIERQCRCPETNRYPNVIIHHHHHHHEHNANNHNNNNAHIDNNRYRSYYEKDKLQHKRLLVGDFATAAEKFENLHLKKLMQKLGAVYEEDLQMPPQANSYMQHEDNNDAFPSTEEDYDEWNDNEFPHDLRRNNYAGLPAATTTTTTTHMRHSGHMTHKTREFNFISGCPSDLGIEDGYTIADKTRHYKLCQPVHKLPVCKHFREYTWTLTTSSDSNTTEQIVHCRCPKNSVTYLIKREPALDSTGYKYLFACSPLTRLRCQRKQPCKLFTVRKRQEFLDEVNINALCQCPKGHHCPSHHTQSGVIPGESFLEDNIQTYSGYCMIND